MKNFNSCICFGFFWAKLFSSLILIQIKQSPVAVAIISSFYLEKNLTCCVYKPLSFIVLNTNKCAWHTYYFKNHPFRVKSAARLIHLIFKCCPGYGCSPETRPVNTICFSMVESIVKLLKICLSDLLLEWVVMQWMLKEDKGKSDCKCLSVN